MESRHISPAQMFLVALYIVSLIQTASTPAPVITTFYAIKWVHEICGMNSPTDSEIVSKVLESAKRILRNYTIKKSLFQLIFLWLCLIVCMKLKT